MAKRRKKRIASRGSVNTTILKTLVNGDKYGYEIIKEVEEYSEGKIVLKQPSLYSSLSRFEEKGIVSSYWGDSDLGGRRHYYHLTEKGHQYYRISVLKIKDDDINQEEILDQLDIEDKKTIDKQNDNVTTTELDPEEIPAILDFEKSDHTEKTEPTEIYDHNFHNTTPLEKIAEEPIKQEKDNQSDSKKIAWSELIIRAKRNNHSCSITAQKRLHYNRPKVTQKVVLDSDGIYKLRDQDYVPTKHNVTKPKIVDNVGKRIQGNSYYDSIYGPKKESKPIELSPEEKLRRNQEFEERFEILTKSKMKEPAPEKVVEKTSPIADKEVEVDYRSKLDIFIDNSQSNSDEEDLVIPENNMFNYIDENEPTQSNDKEDKFINFEYEDFEVKNENKQYIEEISNYSATTQEPVKINKFENSRFSNDSDSKTYVLINKVKCLFGIILLLICSLELTLSLVIFNNNNLMQAGDNKLFIFGYIVSFVIAATFIIPVFINSQEHKLNNYKLKYSLILGILTFLVSLILIYCINALAGFELDNFNHFAVKLIVPAILTFNFVIAPPIYAALINCKKFYD